MSDEEEKPKSWWHTLPGMITSLAAAVTAVVGMVVAIKQTDWWDHSKPAPGPSDPPSGDAPTADIWQALEVGDYHAAINKARICINSQGRSEYPSEK